MYEYNNYGVFIRKVSISFYETNLYWNLLSIYSQMLVFEKQVVSQLGSYSLAL